MQNQTLWMDRSVHPLRQFESPSTPGGQTTRHPRAQEFGDVVWLPGLYGLAAQFPLQLPHTVLRAAQLMQFARFADYLFQIVGKARSEKHTSELQSQSNLVCRLLLEKKQYNEPLQSARGRR